MAHANSIASAASPSLRLERRWRFGLVAAVFALVAALHGRLLQHEFVWDDLQVSVDGYIHDSAHWTEVLTLRTYGRDMLDNNRPGVLLSLMFDAAIWGKNPAGYHLTNLLLHAANAALLCLVAWIMLRRRHPGLAPAWIAGCSSSGALVFALHPLIVEPVSVVAFREDPQATFCVLLALIFALRLESAGSRVVRASLVMGALLAVAVGIATKESAVVAPWLLLAVWWTGRTSRTGSAVRPWAWLVVGSFAVVAGLLTLRFSLAPASSEVYLGGPGRLGTSWFDWAAIQSRITAFHVERALGLAPLAADYTTRSYAHISTGLGIAVSVVLLGGLVLALRHSRLACFGACLIAGGLAAVSNVVPLFNPVADRYLYLPLAGAALIIVALIAALERATVRSLALVSAAVAVGFVGLQHRVRLAVFHDDVALWTDTLAKTPDSIPAGNLRGWGLYQRGQYADALRSFERALENARGGEPDSWAGGALACQALGDPAAADHAYRSAVDLMPLFRERDRIKRAYFWRDEYLDRLAVIGRRTGLWVENNVLIASAKVAAQQP